MLNPDRALQALRDICVDFTLFVNDKGKASEADTRVKFIDRILTQVLGWPEAAVSREDHVESGFIDYVLKVAHRPYVAVEAKREGVAFTSPETQSRSLSLSGALITDKEIAAAISQVRDYCDDGGIRYAIATNGYAWIVFRAIREDMPWRKGQARIYRSIEQIDREFTEFWNLLSYEAISRGSLDEEFGSAIRKPRRLYRVVDRMFNADLPLQRNRLHAQLHPLIQRIFVDIADQDPIEILQSCYVHTASLKIVAQDLNAVITDSIPQFLLEQGAEQVRQGEDDAGRFGYAIEYALATRTGQLYLLLGGIGSGKTTFIKRFQREVGQSILESKTLWFHLDFLESPLDPSMLEDFVWKGLLEQLRSRFFAVSLETRKNIKRAFADRLGVLTQTGLRGTYLQSRTEYEDALSPYLEKWQENLADYVPRILSVARNDRHLNLVLFVDNVDQLPPAYQAQVFVLAQRVSRLLGSITVLSLREESYYTANLQKTLTAYTSRKFHIASPRFRKMIHNRIRFALDMLEASKGPVDYVFRGGIAIDKAAIADFLRIVEASIFQKNLNIARFIEALCFGNMRMAIDMFTTFMTSGATDVDKMLALYRKSGKYYVAFHEFVKSIMLGERRYYKDQASFLMNIFDCGAERNSSHFTGLRALHALSLRRGESTKEGVGYVDIGKLVSASEDLFDNREDIIRSLNRLVSRQLVEVNTRSAESISGASHVRLTSAGWYYAKYLVRAFSYVDLVLQDTPLNDFDLERELRSFVEEVDNLSDRDDQKLERMKVRFARVRKFLEYLDAEERHEVAEFDLHRRGGMWAVSFMPSIKSQIEREIAWIEKRVAENRELVNDDITIMSEGQDEFEVGDEDKDAEESEESEES